MSENKKDNRCSIEDYVDESTLITFSDTESIYIIFNDKNIADQVLEWTKERNMEYDKLSDEDKFALSFFMRSL